MSIELENLKNATATNRVDQLSYAGLVGSTVVSLVTQQAAFATVPISLVLMAQIFSRQKKLAALVEAHQRSAESVQQVGQTLESLAEKTAQTLDRNEKTLDHLTQENNQHNLESITIKERLDQQSQTIAKQAGQLDAFDSTLSDIKEITAVGSLASQSTSAESHFTRGTHQEKLGHLEIAIEDYSQAIEQSPDFAKAYLRRGMVKAELDRKQSAVIDLNLATKYFFESGDLTNYQRAKNLSDTIHTGGLVERVTEEEETPSTTPELVSINGLFGG